MLLRTFLAISLISTAALADVSREISPMDLGTARPRIMKGGMHVRQLMTTENDGMGTLIGAKFATFLSDEFYMGAAASGGFFTSGEYIRSGMGYGGFQLGIEQKVERRVAVDAGLLIGLAAARPGSSLAIEPSLSIIQAFSGWQMAFNMSYLHMSDLKPLSGVTLGLSFEKRIFNLDFLE